MNEILQALVLGIIQGLTELLPISSSAHLNLFPWIFGWNEISQSFDVALHIGTLFAIVLFFFKDGVNLIKGGYNQVVKKKKLLVHSYIRFIFNWIMYFEIILLSKKTKKVVFIVWLTALFCYFLM